jgi:hypothetical protein
MRVIASKIAFLGVFCNDNPSGQLRDRQGSTGIA